jgi:pimeloyl-ACP methyl ester carboxylesterase
VKALILQGCGPGYRSDTARHTWNERAENRAQTLERGGLDALGGGAEVTVSKQGTAQGLAHAARGILSQIDASVIDSLPGIRVPTLVVIGDGDTPYLTGSKYMSERIPGVRSVVVPGAGHGVNVEKPEVVNPLFEQFLSAL